MQRHGLVEIGLLCAHTQRDRGHLHNFGGVRPDDVHADDPVARLLDNELHQHALVAAGEDCFHWAEAALIDLHIAVPGSRFVL